MDFQLLATDKRSKARRGRLTTDHGTIDTPAFMPVGTLGGVKAAHLKDLAEETRTQMVLANSYHLYLRPGTEVIKAAGGLHHFSQWHGPTLTDSGGYQVYSLADIRNINEEGVTFQSHIDGSKHLFTPERVVDIQRNIGADVIMAFDECPPYPCEEAYAKQSMKLTHRWLERGMQQFQETSSQYDYAQTLFPIAQGSVYKDLRKASAETVAEYGEVGHAIGGLSVGEPHDLLYEMTEVCCDILPTDKIRYLMGVGMPENILESIALGIDLFDCVIPTRNGRNGMLFTQEGIINIKNKKWEKDFSPIDPKGWSFASRVYPKAYLRHLQKSNEMLGAQIATLNNLGFYQWLVQEAGHQIEQGTFRRWKARTIKKITQRL